MTCTDLTSACTVLAQSVGDGPITMMGCEGERESEREGGVKDERGREGRREGRERSTGGVRRRGR